MTTYQDVIVADLPIGAWALTESSGTTFAPYAGATSLTGSGTFLYRQTGPIALGFALHVAAAASLHTNTIAFPTAGGYVESWFKFDTFPPASTEAMFYWGNSSSNGNGLLTLNTGALNEFAPPSSTLVIPVPFASGWHLLQWGNASTLGGTMVGMDGQVIYQKSTGVGGTAGNPDQIGFCSTSSSGSGVAISLAWPAVYSAPLTATAVFSHFLASTDPDTAITLTATAGSASNDLLNQILAAVQKTFPAT